MNRLIRKFLKNLRFQMIHLPRKHLMILRFLLNLKVQMFLTIHLIQMFLKNLKFR
jgi:hypothetical protein